MKRQILVDTNIIIGLEDNKIIEDDFSKLVRISNKNDCLLVYHPMTIKDIENDKDIVRKKITISKIAKYEKLIDAGVPDQEFLKSVSQNNENDLIDNNLLYQAYTDYVYLFVTQDERIISKAEKLSIRYKVLRIKEAIKYLNDEFEIKIPGHPEIKHESTRNVEKFLNTSFFDSFREDYPGFDLWFKYKCSSTNRYCYSVSDWDKMYALCIYKIEETDEHKIQNYYGKALKINSLKVGTDVLGLKIGELFISKMIEYAMVNKEIPLIYLTAFPKQKHLINLLETFGFEGKIHNSDGEIRFEKWLTKEFVKKKSINTTKSYPFLYDGTDVKKYIMPIKPEYRSILFKDKRPRVMSLFDRDPLSRLKREVSGNAIVKAYISKSKIAAPPPGSIVFFYYSQQPQSIEVVGFVKTYQEAHTLDEILELATNRTVYTQEELSLILKTSAPAKVCLFVLSHYLLKPVPITVIRELQCFSNKFQNTTLMPESDYQTLRDSGYLNERYLIH